MTKVFINITNKTYNIMKKSIFTAIIVITIIFFSSCKTDIEEITTPTFKLTSFQKESINGIYYCKATVKITNLIENYSIDGFKKK